MKCDARTLELTFGRDGLQVRIIEERREGLTVLVKSFGQRLVWYSSWVVLGASIANAIRVFKLI